MKSRARRGPSPRARTRRVRLIPGAGTHSRHRQEAVWTLGRIGGSGVVPDLREALRDPDVEVRREAVWALARMGGPAVIPVLEEARRDSDPEVRSMAIEVLGTIRRKHAPATGQPADTVSPATDDEFHPPSGAAEA